MMIPQVNIVVNQNPYGAVASAPVCPFCSGGYPRPEFVGVRDRLASAEMSSGPSGTRIYVAEKDKEDLVD
jgi:hypothetical protein